MGMKNKTLILFIIGLLLLVGLVGLVRFARKSRINDRVPLQIGTKALMVELALSPKEQIQGLSRRESIDESSGMLFVFSSAHKPTFWMKDMRFPLDIIWIRDNHIVDIHEHVPMPPPDNATLPLYSPKEDVTMALEVRAGSSARWGIHIGDSVDIDNSKIIRERRRV